MRKVQATAVSAAVWNEGAERGGFETPSLAQHPIICRLECKFFARKKIPHSGSSCSFPVITGYGGPPPGQFLDNSNSHLTINATLTLIFGCLSVVVVALIPALQPRRSGALRVVIVARISTTHQDPRSLDDQVAKCKEYLEQHFSGEVEYTEITSQGSGEHLDRDELRRLEDLIESRTIDVVLAEDLARICRRKRAYDLCEMCVDNESRLIAINDRGDTDTDGWEDSAFISTWHHERSNRDTSDRIKRSQRNRFNQGGMVQFEIFGIIKPLGAKSDSEFRKDPAAEPIYSEWFRKFEAGASFAEVADWLNSENVPVGRYCRSKTWTGEMVGRVTHNSILKGVRERNRKVSKRVNKTGRHRSVNGQPGDLLERNCPHLAFFEASYYDRVVRLVDKQNACYGAVKNGHDPRKGRPRKRTKFPGQLIDCGICGGQLNFGGHGQADHLLCTGAHAYRCWNAITVDGPLAAKKISAAVLAEIMNLPTPAARGID